jgi:hypothetical protein
MKSTVLRIPSALCHDALHVKEDVGGGGRECDLIKKGCQADLPVDREEYELLFFKEGAGELPKGKYFVFWYDWPVSGDHKKQKEENKMKTEEEDKRVLRIHDSFVRKK